MKLPSEKGQGLVEYGLILTLVAIVICGVFACIAFLAWPWIVGTFIPWLGTVIAGVQAGNLTSIAILAVLVLFVCNYTLSPRSTMREN